MWSAAVVIDALRVKVLNYTGQKMKGSNVYPVISGTFLIVCKTNHFYLQKHSFCKFCTFEVLTYSFCLDQDQA